MSIPTFNAGCIEKQTLVKQRFVDCSTPEERYDRIILLGKEQRKLPPSEHSEANRVIGCQSKLYLVSKLENGKVYFETESDALISAGLAQLLVLAYSGESPEAILSTPPTFLTELGIPASLSPSRSNGLASLYAKMRAHAAHFLSR